MEESLQTTAHLLAMTIEAGALLAIAAGLAIALILAIHQRRRQGDWKGTYDHLRRRVGRTLLIALELLLAAEIARSIFAGETLNAALTLGVVVLVRTFLSIAIEMEINGRWPWHEAANENQQTLDKH
ncbi:DUF1622 domain-containing protein [Lujinxingia vulgaris]|uniref:DUF1622 domain-containing protein n=1 Tax=Lujinxingia vulgaris TaxID=2600176 RepID=A0A5C6X7L2_9DELT|nr:DUF1622 domain-containing protein [Lujinxingia vulgaris]TXD37284.1 DUF1622 domain-containing protein [Lujinxingia vulgaris]